MPPVSGAGRPIFVLDSNIWIVAGRVRAASHELAAFQSRRRGRVHMLSVVAQELTAGARSAERRRELNETLASFEDEGRTLAVSYQAERDAGRVLAALAERAGVDPGRLTARFLNDVRIAAACREHGAVLVTRNVADFVVIQPHLAGFRFLEPWP